MYLNTVNLFRHSNKCLDFHQDLNYSSYSMSSSSKNMSISTNAVGLTQTHTHTHIWSNDFNILILRSLYCRTTMYYI